MIEAGIGLAVTLIGILLAADVAGLVAGVRTLGALGLLAGQVAIAVGLALTAHGLYRRARDRHPSDTTWMRACGLAAVTLISVVLVMVLALLVLAKVAIGSMPAGYHMLALGVPLLLLVLLGVLLRKQASIERATAIGGRR